MAYAARARLTRALSQRIMLMDIKETMDHQGRHSVEMEVMGTSGTPYTVHIGHKRLTCTCPDQTMRHTMCKHILFCVARVGNLRPTAEEIVTQRSEMVEGGTLKKIAEAIHCHAASRIRMFKAAAAAEAHAGSSLSIAEGCKESSDSPDAALGSASTPSDLGPRDNDSCPICFESVDVASVKDPTLYHATGCRTNFHLHCIEAWLNKKAPDQRQCPICRGMWE